jgi:hypothetical protein
MVAVGYFDRVYDGGAPEVDFGRPINEFSEGSVRRAQFAQTLSISHHQVGKISPSGEI